jgi:hypothetical protein
MIMSFFDFLQNLGCCPILLRNRLPSLLSLTNLFSAKVILPALFFYTMAPVSAQGMTVYSFFATMARA